MASSHPPPVVVEIVHLEEHTCLDVLVGQGPEFWTGFAFFRGSILNRHLALLTMDISTVKNLTTLAFQTSVDAGISGLSRGWAQADLLQPRVPGPNRSHRTVSLVLRPLCRAVVASMGVGDLHCRIPEAMAAPRGTMMTTVLIQFSASYLSERPQLGSTVRLAMELVYGHPIGSLKPAEIPDQPVGS